MYLIKVGFNSKNEVVPVKIMKHYKDGEHPIWDMDIIARTRQPIGIFGAFYDKEAQIPVEDCNRIIITGIER